MLRVPGSFLKSFILLILISGGYLCAAPQTVAYDIDMAEEICKQLPLENVEGIWLYPEDKVKVMVLKDRNSIDMTPVYEISVVETEDVRLRPGEILGHLYATPQENTFKIELNTERKNDLLLKPKTVTATLSASGDSFIFKRQKSPFKARLNLNFNRLLPGFWKIISTGVTQTTGNVEQPTGMIKIYPSYDGNGSSKREIRYL